ncbi:LuxR C-terminal-related transcriptional regulator [Streptomyces sp. NPDC052721]|uniref:helix-turn-helix transcriptional regulator n=1 Tax=Streptomyces sp. NPDC052721 TaxID=3154955 RepID=UPI00342A86DC
MTQAIDNPWTAAGAAAGVSALPVRGRRAEQERLTQWVRRHVHRNGGGVLWIEGPAGAGKSRMLTSAGTEAALAGAQVLTGAGLARGQLTPLAPLLDALAAEADDFAHGPRAGSPEEGASYWLLREVGNRLRALSQERPVVLLLDDVHDCDDLTLLAVRTLTARLAGLPLLWVLASRAHPDAPAVRTLRRDLLTGQAAHLELPPLAPDAVRQMTQDLLGPRATAAVPYLRYLDGLPGLVRQLCAHLQDGSPAGAHGRADAPTVLAALVTRRLDQLSEDGRELVLIASVLGGTLTVQHLSQVLGRPEPTLLRPLREVLAAQLLHAGHDRLSFPHEAVREAVAATLPRPLRRSVRRRSVEVRMNAGVPAVSLAAELIDLAEPGDARAGRVLRIAAQELAPVAPGTAARYLQRAMELTEEVCPERQRLSAELIPLLWQAGDVAEARDLARRVVQGPPDPLTHAQACLELARMGSQFRIQQPDAHIRHVHRRRDVPVAVKDQLLSTTLLNRLLAGEVEVAGGAMAESLMRTRGVHPVSELTHRTLQSMSACHRQNWADALKHSEAAAAGIAHLDPARAAALPEVALATSWRAALLSLSGDDRNARDLVEEAAHEAEQRGRQALLPLWRTARARLLLEAGQLTAATRELASAEAATTATGMSFTGELTALCTKARVAFHTGNDATMEACAAQADACLTSDDPQRRRIGAWITVIAMTYRDGCADLTPRQLSVALPYLSRGYVHATPVDPGETILLVRAALGAGLREVAVTAVEFAERRARRNPRFPLFGTVAAHARGLLDGDADRLVEAAERYGTARPLLRAQAWEDAGGLPTAMISPEARACFERALEGYEACGAHRDVRRVRSRLRKLGIKTGARPSVKPAAAAPAAGAPDAGWRGLTPSELGVVRLIAHGATNRQAAERLFLSPHTVNTHVRHAFEKLGIRSRVQLARLYLSEVDQPGAVG